MIIRTLVVTFFCLLGWSVALQFLPGGMDWDQPQWNENVALAQDYLYGPVPDSATIVVVGSSLTQLLPLDSLAGQRVIPLALGGQGVLDGLRILLARPQLPGTVLIETNLLPRPPNERFATTVLHPLADRTRRYVPALRQRNQPAAVLLGGMSYLKNGPASAQRPTGVPRPVNRTMLGRRQEEYARPFADGDLSNAETLLAEYLGILDRRGTRVVFYEMPVDDSLCQSLRATALRAWLRELPFVAGRRFIPQPPCAAYATTDGHHLREDAALAYVGYLADRLLRSPE